MNIGKFTVVYAIIFVVEVQISGRSNQTQPTVHHHCIISPKEVVLPSAMTRIWATQTRQTLRRITANIMKHERFDLIGGQEKIAPRQSNFVFSELKFLSFGHNIQTLLLGVQAICYCFQAPDCAIMINKSIVLN